MFLRVSAVLSALRVGPGAVSAAVLSALLLMATPALTRADDAVPSDCRAGAALADVSFMVDIPVREGGREGTSSRAYIDFGDAKQNLAHLRDGDEVVLPCHAIIVVADYPLKSEFEFPLTADRPEGFTRAGIASMIVALYQRIYAEEEQTSTTPVVPIEKRQGLINRNRTAGKYGIWGHDLGDLALTTISPERRGAVVYVRLGIDS